METKIVENYRWAIERQGLHELRALLEECKFHISDCENTVGKEKEAEIWEQRLDLVEKIKDKKVLRLFEGKSHRQPSEIKKELYTALIQEINSYSKANLPEAVERLEKGLEMVNSIDNYYL